MKFFCFVAAMIAWPLASVSAATFCVHNGAELEAALATASTNNLDDNIKLTPGTYTPSNERFIFASNDLHGLAISGGYATAPGATPCSTFLGGAQWSVLDGAGSKRVLEIYTAGASAAPVFVHDLTLANGISISTEAPILIGGDNQWTGDVIVENVSVRGNHTSFAIAQIGTKGHLIVRSSEFVGNTSTEGGGIVLALLSNRPLSGASIMFNNNTVAGNSVPASSNRAGVTFSGNGPGDVRIANNIVWNNGGTDMSLTTSGTIYLDHNDIGSRSVGGGVIVDETGSYNVDPHFVSAGDGHLHSASPLRDAGVASPIGGVGSADVEGNARVVFGGVDLGAYEIQDRIFKDGFD